MGEHTKSKVVPMNRAESQTGLELEFKKEKSVTLKVKGERYFDYNLFIVVIFLVSFGLVMLYSASVQIALNLHGDDLHFFLRQGTFSVVSIVGMIIISRINYHVLLPFALFLYVFQFVLLALVRFSPLGSYGGGARRWLMVTEDIRFQPSEITKIAVIVFIAFILCKMGKKAFSLKGAALVFLVGGLASAGVFFLTNHLSTAIVIMAITVGMYFVMHPKYKWFAFVGVLSVFVAGIGIWFVRAQMAVSEDFRMMRIISWLDPDGHAAEGNFQVLQSLHAIGSGGFFGRGLGNSTQKLGVIPEAHNDMIIAVIAEELGIFGVVIILLLFSMLLYRMMFVAQNAPDLFGSLIVTGIFIQIAVQVILNIAVVTNLIPATGITLPFISFGGTSVIFLLAQVGLVLGVSRQIRLEE